MYLRTAILRFAPSRVPSMAGPQSRMLSYQGQSAVRKLQEVMEAYRIAK